MKPQRRMAVNKRKSAGQFRHNISKTKAKNLKAPMRGGLRI